MSFREMIDNLIIETVDKIQEISENVIKNIKKLKIFKNTIDK